MQWKSSLKALKQESANRTIWAPRDNSSKSWRKEVNLMSYRTRQLSTPKRLKGINNSSRRTLDLRLKYEAKSTNFVASYTMWWVLSQTSFFNRRSQDFITIVKIISNCWFMNWLHKQLPKSIFATQRSFPKILVQFKFRIGFSSLVVSRKKMRLGRWFRKIVFVSMNRLMKLRDARRWTLEDQAIN